jgi:hypothetical protein
MIWHPRAACAIVIGATVATHGCQRSPASDAPAGAAANSVHTAVPTDHLAPGELLEGAERAFGLPLPRGMRVDARFVDAVYASGPVLLHPFVQYVRSRLQGGDLREGETSATFEHVSVGGQPARELRLHASSAAGIVHVAIQDTTAPPPPNLPDEKARWRQVGLTPEGRLADPTHLD